VGRGERAAGRGGRGGKSEHITGRERSRRGVLVERPRSWPRRGRHTGEGRRRGRGGGGYAEEGREGASRRRETHSRGCQGPEEGGVVASHYESLTNLLCRISCVAFSCCLQPSYIIIVLLKGLHIVMSFLKYIYIYVPGWLLW